MATFLGQFLFYSEKGRFQLEGSLYPVMEGALFLLPVIFRLNLL